MKATPRSSAMIRSIGPVGFLPGLRRNWTLRSVLPAEHFDHMNKLRVCAWRTKLRVFGPVYLFFFFYRRRRSGKFFDLIVTVE